MKRSIEALCLLAAALTLCSCTASDGPPETVEISIPPASSTPLLTPAPACTPEPTIIDDPEMIGPDGLTALEFAAEFPETACDTVQLGIIQDINESSVTFRQAVWLIGDELPDDYAGDYDVVEDGKTVTFEIHEEC